MIKKKSSGDKFYGTTTLGEKGQVVIPAEARQSMEVKKGEKLLVFGMGREMVTLMKLSNAEQLAFHLSRKLQAIREVIKKTKP